MKISEINKMNIAKIRNFADNIAKTKDPELVTAFQTKLSRMSGYLDKQKDMYDYRLKELELQKNPEDFITRFEFEGNTVNNYKALLMDRKRTFESQAGEIRELLGKMQSEFPVNMSKKEATNDSSNLA